MYLYNSEHQLMDYHAESLLANAEKDKAETKKEVKEPEDGLDTDRTE